MRLFNSAGACSIGIHIMLREIGVPFELTTIQTKLAQARTPEYLAMNPKGKVPTLVRDDGSVLTEFPAIAFYLAWTYPEAKLLGTDVESMTRSLELFEYLVSTVHMQGLHRVFAPMRIAPDANIEGVTAEGIEIVQKAFRLLDPMLADRDYIMGDFSIVDGPLFYIVLNAHRRGLDIPSNLRRYLSTMLGRPSVQATIEAEGITDWIPVN